MAQLACQEAELMAKSQEAARAREGSLRAAMQVCGLALFLSGGRGLRVRRVLLWCQGELIEQEIREQSQKLVGYSSDGFNARPTS